MNDSQRIDKLIRDTDDWRGDVLAKLRKLMLAADAEIVEAWKFMGTPVFSKNTMICCMNPHAGKVKLTFNYGAELRDPDKLFNSSLDGNQRRAIDFLEGEMINERALKALLKEALAFDAAKAKKKPASKAKAPSKAKAAPRKSK